MAKDIPLVPDSGAVSRPAALLMLALFILILVVPPAIQPVCELLGEDGRVQELDLFRPRKDLLAHLQEYEKALEKRSVVSAAVQPWVQQAQLSILRQGNEKVIVAPDDWLFYRPCVDFVTGPAFSDVGEALRPNEEGRRNPDPFPAIVRFHEDLKALGIDLVLVPVPVKASIYPERLAARYDPAHGPPVNRALSAFYQRLAEKEIAVVDLTRALWDGRREDDLYLPLDSHWSPQGMGRFASALAAELKRRFPYLESPAGDYRKRAAEVTNRGDLFDMLRLPAGTESFERTTAALEQIIDVGTEKPVESDEKSPIVLLGDSATNIFSADSMKWGAHAGLGEHLAFHLARPLHVIAVNGGAATEARRRLAAHGVAGKTLVVWQFILRDLTHPDPKVGWEIVPIAPAEAAPAAPLPAWLAVKAKVVRKSEPPVPDAAEIYPDTVTHTLYEVQDVLEGEFGGREIVVAEWVQLKKKPTPAADHQVGDVHALVLEPLREARRKNKAISIAGSVDDVKRPELPVFWAAQHKGDSR